MQTHIIRRLRRGSFQVIPSAWTIVWAQSAIQILAMPAPMLPTAPMAVGGVNSISITG